MRPDPLSSDLSRHAWRPFLATSLTAGILIVAGKLWLMPWMARYLAAPDPEVAARHFTRFMAGFAALLVLMAVWIAILAGRILRSGQVPPPGAWTLRRAPRRGREARAAGVVLALCAAGLVALAVFALRIPGRALAGRGTRAGAAATR